MSRPMTVSEKILAAHATLDEVHPNQFVECGVDLVLANDITAPPAIRSFELLGATDVFDNTRVCLVNDHNTPNKDIKSAQQAKETREFAKAHNITHFWDVGRCGIEHALLPEQGVVCPGDLVVGADSHTCTYGALGAFATGVGSTDAAVAMATGRLWFKVPESIRVVFQGTPRADVCAKDLVLKLVSTLGVDGALYRSIEFTGEAVSSMSMEGRLTVANMSIEAGAKAGIFEVDETTRSWFAERGERPAVEYHSDPDAPYAHIVEIDASTVEPLVSWPHLPSNARPARDSRHVGIDQVVIGSCTNGRIEDMRAAAGVLSGHRVHEGVRCIVIPATPDVWRACVDEGLMDIFLDANCVVSPPTCGPCLGGHMGVLAAGERCVSTTNRNFVGRMGHTTSEVYLAGPFVAAASAVAGHIALPEDLV